MIPRRHPLNKGEKNEKKNNNKSDGAEAYLFSFECNNNQMDDEKRRVLYLARTKAPSYYIMSVLVLSNSFPWTRATAWTRNTRVRSSGEL